MDTEQTTQIFVDGGLFLGRVEEQKQFRAALQEVAGGPAEAPAAGPAAETLPYIILLHGDGGIGKTTLSRRFWQIAHEEEPFAGAFQGLWLDWEELRRHTPALQVARESIEPELVLELLYKTAVNQWGKKQFRHYPQAVQDRAEAETAVTSAVSRERERDEMGAKLAGLTTSALAKLIRLSLPVGEPGETAAKTLLDAGVELGAGEAARVRAALTDRLQRHLKPEQFRLFSNPLEHLAQALGQDLGGLTQGWFKGKPLLLVLDTYEIVDRSDVWLRQVIRAAGPQVVWVISGRDNLADSRFFGGENFVGYRADFPRRLQTYNLGELALADLQAYFAHAVPERPLGDEAAAALTRVTRGIPLAIREAAAIWQAGTPLADIVGDEPAGRISHAEIVARMTERYLRYALESEADRQALYALALAAGDIDQLQAMLRPDDDAPFDLEARLAHLARAYASVHLQTARLHNAATQFIQAYLRQPVRRQSDPIRRLNEKRLAALTARLDRQGAGFLLEDRCADEDWQQTVLALADVHFWLDEGEAWRWLILHYVAGLAYSGALWRGLVETAVGWRDTLSRGGRKRLKLLQANEGAADVEEEAALLRELARLARAGWLAGEEEAERQAILTWQQAKLLYRQKAYEAALALIEPLAAQLPGDGDRLREQVAETMYQLAGHFLWPGEQTGATYSAAAERLMPQVVAWLPEKQDAWYRLGVTLKQAGRLKEAIPAYEKAISLDATDASPHNGLGNVYGELGRHNKAIAAYEKAIALDPKLAYAHNGLGNVYRALERHDEAIAAFEQAIALDPKLATAHYNLGAVYSELGRYEEAIAAYEQAIALDPKDATAHLMLGVVYSNTEQINEAIGAYEQAISLDPKNGTAHASLAAAYRAVGRAADAQTHLEQARALMANESAYNRACLEALSGHADEALALLAEALAVAPGLRLWAKRDSDFATLRDDPRFQALVGSGPMVGR
jgi:tetratricopeptide (TPR) repeat protein